ncbi:MAG: tetratricopeptide repeat protein [Hyphomonas sp.]
METLFPPARTPLSRTMTKPSILSVSIAAILSARSTLHWLKIPNLEAPGPQGRVCLFSRPTKRWPTRLTRAFVQAPFPVCRTATKFISPPPGTGLTATILTARDGSPVSRGRCRAICSLSSWPTQAAFFLGMQTELRDGPVQSLRAFRRGEDGYGVLMGMASFGFEECGDFALAEDYGKEAVAIDPRDGWAVHAVAHVNEMRGDLDAGIPWLADTAQDWAPESGFAYHNWWHLALLYLDAGNTDEVLRLYDTQVRPNPDSQVLLEGIDASSLLWRLLLEGVDVGDRFEPLAAAWERAAEDGNYAFNDLHALMAFVGAGRNDLVERTLKAMKRAAAGQGDNAYLSQAIGFPLAQGFADFGAGRFAKAAEQILGVRGIAQRFGGSHAQRDILTLTALHAAIRGKMKPVAEALSHERLQQKPRSAWAGRLALRVSDIAREPDLARAG